MSQNEGQLRLSFLQLIILLAVQVGLLAGSFYLGTRMGGFTAASPKGKVQDQELAKLLPETNTPSGSESGSEAKPEENTGSRKAGTPFDKSPSTVFRIKSSSNSEYTVQVASYPDELAATQVVDEWKKKGYMAFLSVEDIPDRGKWYRVNVGNFGEEQAAEKFAKTIEEKEKVTPQVVVSE
jgi:cell division septation protein DedD